jgi:hypothetical protein
MKDDRSRLLTDVVGALIDRMPIDWRALRARVRAPVDAHLIENLRTLETIRHHSLTTATEGYSASRIAAIVIAGIATLQLAVGILSLGRAVSLGHDLGPRLPQILLALAFTIAAALVGASRAREERRLFLLTAFLVVASAFTRGTLLSFDARVVHVSLEAFLPACVWQFALDFPKVHRFTSFDVWARRIARTMWIVGCLTFVTLDASESVFWHVITISMAPAVAAIFIRSRRAPYQERRKVTRLALALVAGGVPFLALGVARAVVPAVNRWLSNADAAERFWVDLVVLGGLITSPILTTIAVLVDRPFALRPKWWHVARTRSLSAGHLARAIERVTAARGPRETIFVLDRELRSGIGATRTRIMTPVADGGFSDPSRDLTSLAPGTALQALVEEATTIDLSDEGPVMELLPASDRKWITSNAIALIAPIRRRTGDIVALVAIGPRRGGQSYVADDQRFVAALAAAAGLAWDADRLLRESSPEQPAYECESCGRVTEVQEQSCACGGRYVLAAVPQQLAAKFRVERRIGRGGAGVVYLARDITIDREVALKTLPALQRGAVARLAQEARTMASLRHDGLAIIHGLEIWRDTPILVVEYFRDGTLARRLANGPLSASETIQVGIALARTLAYLHGRGLLHRDLKPSNVAWSATGSPVLLDFGVATWFEPRAASQDASTIDRCAIAGTPAYLPPEAFHGAPASTAFDLWALGVVLIECVSGTNPFAGRDHSETIRRVVGADLVECLAKMRQTAPALAAILTRALDPDAARRFRTATELEHALEVGR